MTPTIKPQVVTANRLTDGVVVYLAKDHSWAERIEDSRLSSSASDGEAMIACAAKAVTEREVIDPYLIDVTATVGAVVPTSYREVIRAVGPSVRPDLCRKVAGIPPRGK